MAELKKIAEELVNLTVKDVKELGDILKNEYGIEPAAAVAPAMVAAEAGQGEKQEEKTIFDVILKSYGSNKLQVVKAVKNIVGLGLKEAKDLVDGAPQPILSQVPKEEAEKVKKELVEIGAEVELK